MKTLIYVYAILFILMATACQPGSQEAVVAGVNAACINNPSGCNSSLYQQSNGYTSYGNPLQPFNQYNNQSYLCSCPAGTIPTYNSYSGLGCVYDWNYNYGLWGGAYAYFYIGWGINSWYQIPNLYPSNYTWGTCYNGAVQSCVMSQNTCPAGYTCRPNSGNSELGLCVTAYR